MAHLQNINSYNYGLVFHIPNSILVIYKFASICKFEIKMFHVPFAYLILYCQKDFSSNHRVSHITIFYFVNSTSKEYD